MAAAVSPSRLGPATLADNIVLGAASVANTSLGLQTGDFTTITAAAAQVGYRNVDGTLSFSGTITIAGAAHAEDDELDRIPQALLTPPAQSASATAWSRSPIALRP